MTNQRDFLLVLMIEAVGERALGIQASQLTGIGEWAKQTGAAERIELHADGRMASLSAMMAVALNPGLFSNYQVRGELESLRSLLERPGESASTLPGMFCFGLLENFDVHELKVLADEGEATATIEPTIFWELPDPIVYGQTLGPDQLDATSPVAGEFSYDPSEGTLLPAGTHQLRVTFTPSDPVTYQTASKSVVLTVDKLTPQLSWSKPDAISYGTELGPDQLNPVADTPGSFEFEPMSGSLLSVGQHSLHAEFVPEDSQNVARVFVDTVIEVEARVPEVLWNQSEGITFGDPIGSAQINAVADVPGSFRYKLDNSTVLNAGPHHLTVIFDPEDSTSYTSAEGVVLLSISKSVPNLEWNPIDMVFGQALGEKQLNATSTIPGEFAYFPSVGTRFEAGNHLIQVSFTPADSANYETARASTTVEVSKATPEIRWDVPSPSTYGKALGLEELNAIASVEGNFSYDPPMGTVLDAGTRPLTVLFSPEEGKNYSEVELMVDLKVLPAAPEIDWNPVGLAFGEGLGENQLNAVSSVPGVFIYDPPRETMFPVGSHVLVARFVPQDSSNFKEQIVEAEVIVSIAPWDFNVDGSVEVADIALFVQAYLDPVGFERKYQRSILIGDGDADGALTSTDAKLLSAKLVEASINESERRIVDAISMLDQDEDLDGFDNEAELRAGTDPFDRDDFFRIKGLKREGDRTVVRWRSAAGRAYDVEVSNTGTDGSWTNLNETDVIAIDDDQSFEISESLEGPWLIRVRLMGWAD